MSEENLNGNGHQPSASPPEKKEEEIKASPMAMSLEVDKIFEALSKAQAKIENPDLNQEATLRFWNDDSSSWQEQEYSYADLDACLCSTRAPFGENGLSVIQLPYVRMHERGTVVIITTILAHKSGQWIRCAIHIPCSGKKVSAHRIGSAITYGRRYGLCSIVGLAADRDDDGKAASHDENRDREAAQQKADENLPGAKGSKSKQRKPSPEAINDKTQRAQGLITTTQIAELQAVVVMDKKEIMSAKDFGLWLKLHTAAIAKIGEDKHIKKPISKVKDIPAGAYDQILNFVKNDTGTIKEIAEKHRADEKRKSKKKKPASKKGDEKNEEGVE